MHKMLYLIPVFFTVSCFHGEKASGELALNDAHVLTEYKDLKIDAKLLAAIKKDLKKGAKPFHREVWNIDQQGDEETYVLDTGLVFEFVDEQRAQRVFETYIDQVIAGGNYLFLTNLDFDDDYNTYYDVVLIDGADPFELIKRIGTNGLNYDIYNPDIIKQLKIWDAQVDFKFVLVDRARIHAYMNKLPEDLAAFATAVYEFCPDVIDQGYGDMEEMLQDYKTNKFFWLWWD